jgi:hypothetical protein
LTSKEKNELTTTPVLESGTDAHLALASARGGLSSY